MEDKKKKKKKECTFVEGSFSLFYKKSLSILVFLIKKKYPEINRLKKKIISLHFAVVQRKISFFMKKN